MEASSLPGTDSVSKQVKSVMRPEWGHLRKETSAVQSSFLQTEVNTGITFARIALKAAERRKASRNVISARKAYDTVTSHLGDLPADTPEMQKILKKMATLRQLLKQLGEAL